MDFEIGWTGQEICALRQALRLSRIEFARKLGVTRRSVVSWETGRTTTVRAASRRLLYDVLDGLDNDQRDRFRAALAYPPGAHGDDSPALEGAATGEISLSSAPRRKNVSLFRRVAGSRYAEPQPCRRSSASIVAVQDPLFPWRR